MNHIVRRLSFRAGAEQDLDPLLTREWLVTNGLGGYASGTASGVVTRRYHGLLIAALPAPLGRTIMLSQLAERVKFPDNRRIELEAEELAGGLQLRNADYLTEFGIDFGFPIWRYRVGDVEIEKRIMMPHRQNTVFVHYRLLSGKGPVAIRLRPAIHFRGHDDRVNSAMQLPYIFRAVDDRYELSLENSEFPPLRMMLYGEESAFTIYPRKVSEVVYRAEESRGYESRGELWSPGHFWADLSEDHTATFVASTEGWETIGALDPSQAFRSENQRRSKLISMASAEAQQGTAAQLVLAADQFIIVPVGRQEDAARARATGDELRTVIAGYHWFTDWGRDTMISLEGLTLSTGRYAEAAWILRTFAFYIRDGLIPNMFPEGEKEGLYHTADATLWFFHAVQRYVEITGDRSLLDHIVPKFESIVEHHLRGTHFGIHVDPSDGLLMQGAPGYQLTWMDAKVDDWVVTPRRGKAVEINALWYNALRLLEGWQRGRGEHDKADATAGHADRAYESFNRRFWNEAAGYLYDVVDGEDGRDDPSCRPNQVFSISLDHPVLDPDKWQAVMEVVEKKLLTPVGLRSLSGDSPDYKRKYFGDLRSRDAAYHQGTVWAWLIGPFVDAWLKLHPSECAEARKFLAGFEHELSDACVGQISEVFDAEFPFTPRGCIAQAWSVAEVLRCWIKVTREESDQRVSEESSAKLQTRTG